MIVFTDGAYEEERQVVTHGAVLYDPECGEHLLCLEIVCRLTGSIDGGHRVRNTLYVRVRFFHYWWRSRLGRIFALPELCFGLWITTRPWAVIHSFSPIVENFELLVVNAELEVKLQSLNWYSRVPSNYRVTRFHW